MDDRLRAHQQHARSSDSRQQLENPMKQGRFTPIEYTCKCGLSLLAHVEVLGSGRPVGTFFKNCPECRRAHEFPGRVLRFLRQTAEGDWIDVKY